MQQTSLSDAMHSTAGLPVVRPKPHLPNSPITPGASPLHLTPGVPDSDELFLLAPVVHLPVTRYKSFNPCH